MSVAWRLGSSYTATEWVMYNFCHVRIIAMILLGIYMKFEEKKNYHQHFTHHAASFHGCTRVYRYSCCMLVLRAVAAQLYLGMST